MAGKSLKAFQGLRDAKDIPEMQIDNLILY